MEKKITAALKKVMDPELNVNIVDLGLVYAAVINDNLAEITMTLTTPSCPMSPVFEAMIKNEVGKIPGVKSVKVTFTFDPPWDPSRMTSEVQAALGFS
jgi:metal-sulfur cluster biosynthetic enzyme